VLPPSPASRPSPVTRQQLQLLLRVLVQADADHLRAAALLLALLLQRADPGLRAAFLNGPEASLLLVALVNWGRHAGEVSERIVAVGQEGTWEDAVSVMISYLNKEELPCIGYTHAASAALVLAQCYLEPAAPRHLGGQQQPALVIHNAPPFVLNSGSASGEHHVIGAHIKHVSCVYLGAQGSVSGPCHSGRVR
jgi:hypothetical protein